MTNLRKWLGGGLAAVLGVALFGLSMVASTTEVGAESPPNPPARFVGSVLVDGAPPAAGTVIEARIGNAACGSANVFFQGGEARYVIDSPALDPGATPNCGTDGAVVTFYVGGRVAQQTGTWRNYDINIVNLTVVTPTPTPVATTTTTPGAASPTPRPPATGSGLGSGSDAGAAWLFVALGLGVLAFGVGGTVAARRSR